MSFLRRLTFNLWYLSSPPWDTGISPPELLQYIQQHPAGRAIDLGCGTGTNVITLAKAGWEVTGVDFADLAILLAKRKAKEQGVRARLRVRDVSRLSGIHGPFDLALDMGCFHAVEQRQRYLDELLRVLAARGHWLLYAFFRPEGEEEGPGLTAQDMEQIDRRLHLVWRQDGQDSRGRSSAWFLFEKPSGGER